MATNYAHLQKFAVEFKGSLSRQVVENGTTRKYFRNHFELTDGTKGSVSSPDDLQGLAGEVMFVKQGEPNPSGGTVTQDAFTLSNVTSITGLKAKLERKTLEAQLSVI